MVELACLQLAIIFGAMVTGSLLRGLLLSLIILTNGWLVALSQKSRFKSRDNE